MSANRFGKPPACPVVHTDEDDVRFLLALVAEMPRSRLVRLAHASLLAHGGKCPVSLDAEEQRAMRAWKRAVQPRRAVPGSLTAASEALIRAGLVSWSEASDYELTDAGRTRLAAPDMAWWRWEAALLAPIALRLEAWCAEGRPGHAAGGGR